MISSIIAMTFEQCSYGIAKGQTGVLTLRQWRNGDVLLVQRECVNAVLAFR